MGAAFCMKIMDPSSIAFIVIFAVFLVVIAGLVTYLLIRRQADESELNVSEK